jgi:hypothetical protein
VNRGLAPNCMAMPEATINRCFLKKTKSRPKAAF